jgi:hypothetical protein
MLVLVLSLPLTAHAQDATPAARAALAHQLYDRALAGTSMGTANVEEVYTWSVRWMRAELEAHTPNAAQAHLDRMTQFLTRVHSSVAAGARTTADETACQYYVAEARAWVAHPPTP